MCNFSSSEPLTQCDTSCMDTENQSHLKSDRTNKNSVQFQSWGVGLQNLVGIFRYSYWLLCNWSAKLADQNSTVTHYVGGHCERFIRPNFPLTVFLSRYLGSSRQSVKFTYPINAFKEGTFAWKWSTIFWLPKVSQQFTPFRWPHVKLRRHSENLEMPNANTSRSVQKS